MRRRNFTHSFEAKTYELESSTNPLFPKKTRRLNLWWLVGLSLAASLLVTGFIAVIYGPWFKINSVQVEGAITLDPNQIIKRVTQDLKSKKYFLFPNDHRWFYSEYQTAEVIQNDFVLKSVSVTRDRGVVKVSLVEEVSLIAIRTGEQAFFLNRDGQIVRPVSEAEQLAIAQRLGEETSADPSLQPANILPGMPIIRDVSASAYTPGQEIFSSDTVAKLLRFYADLETLGIKPEQLFLESPQLTWFKLESDKAFTILFDAGGEVETQKLALQAVLKEYAETQDELNYIDVRFGPRVYIN